MKREALTISALTVTIIVAIIITGGCTRPKPASKTLSAQTVASSPTLEAPSGATVVAVQATPTLVPPGEMPLDLTLTLAASPTIAATPTATPTSPPGVPTHTPTPTLTPTTPPGTPGAPIVHIVQRGENLFRIALRYNTTIEAIAAANGIRNPQLIYVGQKLTIPTGGMTPQPGVKTHVVQPGENLFRIALRYGTTPQAIAAANNLPNIHLIYAGQVLRIP